MTFHDRLEAASLLLERLKSDRFKNILENPLILGIPRGSVPMAHSIAKGLNGDFDVVLVHKIGAPDNPEYAVGSVSEFGDIHRSEGAYLYDLDSNDYLIHAAQEEIEKLRSKRRLYSPIHPPLDPRNRNVLIVDDGIATGSTLLAALRAVRSRGPKRLIVAAPVASSTAVEKLGPEVDELVILEMPESFYSISQFYEEFPQVSDSEVIQSLTASRQAKAA